MSGEIAVQQEKGEVKTSEVVLPVVEKNAPVSSEPKTQVATTAAVAKASTKPKAAKKPTAEKTAKNVIAEKPAPAPKVPVKPVSKTSTVVQEKVAEVPNAEKTAKVKKPAPKKPKLVRDSFTVPEMDYALFATLKQRALTAGVEAKKSEILRAAMSTLAKLNDVELVKAIGLVERIKTGRPKK